ncbi:hypothetical protein LH464_07000 [Neorhizobium sp. T786]|nr:hypothetical protein [Neorhizobium xiangyangii]
MTLVSPFNVRSPVFLMELLQAGHIIDNFRFRRVVTGVIFLGRPDDDIDDVRETATTAAALAHGMIDFCGYDQLPAIVVEEPNDNVADLFISYVITATNKHSRSTRQT